MSQEHEFNRIVRCIYKIDSKDGVNKIRKDIFEYLKHYRDNAGAIDLSIHLKERIDNNKTK